METMETEVLIHLSTELPRSHQEQFPVSGYLPKDATSVLVRKRQLDETSENDPLPAKRTLLTRLNAQQLGLEHRETEQADKV
jgi:hypothetical protein